MNGHRYLLTVAFYASVFVEGYLLRVLVRTVGFSFRLVWFGELSNWWNREYGICDDEV